MKLFSDKRSRAPEEAQPAALDPADPSRLAKGFELLFGSQFEGQRHELERLETELGARIERLQKEAGEHARTLEDLVDKSRAAVEREHDEYRRRTAVETEFRQAIAELRATVRGAVAELRENLEQLERRLNEQQQSARTADAGVPSEALARLEAEIAALRAGHVDRAALGALLADAARRLGAGPARGAA